MTYKLLFLKASQKEWDKLASPIREQFKKKLRERLQNPHVPKDKLGGIENCYKIKLRQIGYRLVYQVIDNALIVKVIALVNVIRWAFISTLIPGFIKENIVNRIGII